MFLFAVRCFLLALCLFSAPWMVAAVQAQTIQSEADLMMRSATPMPPEPMLQQPPTAAPTTAQPAETNNARAPQAFSPHSSKQPAPLIDIASDDADRSGLGNGRMPQVALVYELSEEDASSAFIDQALNGAHQANEELRTSFVERRVTIAKMREEVLEKTVKEGYKLVIAIGYQMVPPVIALADKYPDVNFTVIDGVVPPLFGNVQSVVFKDNEGSFLVGMLAAYATKSKIVGFMGGMDVPLIRNFLVGFEQGVHFVDPGIQILNDSVGQPGDMRSAWSNPQKAETLARKQYGKGADVIFAAAGSSGVGVMRVAKELNRLVIGVDSNQNYLFPGTILTSMVKRIDRAVYETIRSTKDGEWKAGIKYMGIKEEAMDYSVDRNNRALISQQMLDALENTKDMIIRGSKTIESYQP